MEEEKAAAYYDELTRKGEGAARFKQGLGFSTGANAVPERGSAIASSSSFLNQFVKASNHTKSTDNKDSEIRSIRDKLKKKPEDPRVPERSYRESSERRRYRSRERDERDKSHRRRSRSSERRSSYVDRERRRSRSRSAERRNRYGDRESRRRSNRSRSLSPRRERRSREDVKEKKPDYSRLIKGYDEMVILISLIILQPVWLSYFEELLFTRISFVML